jgi:hypothetical protein
MGNEKNRIKIILKGVTTASKNAEPVRALKRPHVNDRFARTSAAHGTLRVNRNFIEYYKLWGCPDFEDSLLSNILKPTLF